MPAPLNSLTPAQPHFLFLWLWRAGAVTLLTPEALDCWSESPPEFYPQGLNPSLNHLIGAPSWALQGRPAAAWRI